MQYLAAASASVAGLQHCTMVDSSDALRQGDVRSGEPS